MKTYGAAETFSLPLLLRQLWLCRQCQSDLDLKEKSTTCQLHGVITEKKNKKLGKKQNSTLRTMNQTLVCKTMGGKPLCPKLIKC